MSFENLAVTWLVNACNKQKEVICTQQGSLTYQALLEQVCALASTFQHLDIKANDRVVIALNDGVILHSCFLACIAIGAIPIVVNPKLSQPSLGFIIGDSQASLVVNELNHTVNFELYHNGAVAQSYTYQQLLKYAQVGWHNFHYKQADDVAFMQYTSGTTGNPKGVMHSSSNALNSVRYYAQDVLQAQSEDRFYSLAKCFFGYGLGNSLFFPLACGASVVLDSDWPSKDKVLANLEQYRPTIFCGVPAMYQALLNDSQTQHAFMSVRRAVSAGAPLPNKLFDQWQKIHKTTILDGLGSTELCHIFCSHSANTASAGTIGKPLQQYQIEIRDSQGNVLEEGESGTMWVKGPSLSQGYWRNPQATQAKFQNGWYNSGDLALRDEQGFIHFKGRADDLFKVNGRWVVPSDIEARILNDFNQITELALVPSEDESGLTKAALYIVANTVEQSEIIAKVALWCQNNLSSYQRPITISLLDALPRNDNGKVIRKQLYCVSQEVA
ncbi:AMP-binding protein [Pseudoalteromonas sp. JBTF-M23]|uniref:AMP-binding protein n=1 Tax=Pseudoalteromonas caenipelagi TaxID=2726988 RepID=A0A849VD71_9GAMM|nr:AMP-binding protein [Pseudoalteromonas caenipelagi]NOU51352.1 AMP-binding protein [Pseudoalteromonas caenipelagi]